MIRKKAFLLLLGVAATKEHKVQFIGAEIEKTTYSMNKVNEFKQIASSHGKLLPNVGGIQKSYTLEPRKIVLFLN